MEIQIVPVTTFPTPAPSGLGDLAVLDTVGTSVIDDDAVTNDKLADMATKTYKGRTSALTGSPEDVAVATLKTDLTLVKADVGLGNVDNTSDAAKPVSTATQTALDAKQPLDSDLTTIAGLTATTDNFMVATASAWASRTPTQARTQLGLGTLATQSGTFSGTSSGTNTGDEVGDWVAYTPTGSWVTNVTYTGQYRLVGDTMFLQAKVAVTGTPTNADLTINIPTTHTIDSTKLLVTGASVAAVLGHAQLHDNGTANFLGLVQFDTTTTLLYVRKYTVSGANLTYSVLTTTVPFTWASGDSVVINASFPVVAV